jgi:hypothetical protein
MEPMETLNIDTIGPVPTDDQGNIYVPVNIDCFPGFVELYAVPDTAAHHAAKLVPRHLGRYHGARVVSERTTDHSSS